MYLLLLLIPTYQLIVVRCLVLVDNHLLELKNELH